MWMQLQASPRYALHSTILLHDEASPYHSVQRCTCVDRRTARMVRKAWGRGLISSECMDECASVKGV